MYKAIPQRVLKTRCNCTSRELKVIHFLFHLVKIGKRPSEIKKWESFDFCGRTIFTIHFFRSFISKNVFCGSFAANNKLLTFHTHGNDKNDTIKIFFIWNLTDEKGFSHYKNLNLTRLTKFNKGCVLEIRHGNSIFLLWCRIYHICVPKQFAQKST